MKYLKNAEAYIGLKIKTTRETKTKRKKERKKERRDDEKMGNVKINERKKEWKNVTWGQFFKRNLISQTSFSLTGSLTKSEELLTHCWDGTDEVMLFPRSETHTEFSRIQIPVTDSIPCKNYHFVQSAFVFFE